MIEINYPEIYRNSENVEEFVETAIELGGDEEEAVNLYYELNSKYENYERN